MDSCPLPLVVYWKCEPTHTDVRLDYKFNPSAMSGSSTLKNISLIVPVNGEVTSMKSTPEGVWYVIGQILGFYVSSCRIVFKAVPVKVVFYIPENKLNPNHT